jgi:hypothetical protein
MKYTKDLIRAFVSTFGCCLDMVSARDSLAQAPPPEIVGLLKDWLDELEEEVMLCVNKGATTPKQLAPPLSLSLLVLTFFLPS